MFSPRAVLFHLRQEEAPLLINPAEPTWGRLVCSQAWMWLRARRSHQASPEYERFGITDLSPSHRETKPSWWPVGRETWLVSFVHFGAFSFLLLIIKVCYHFSKNTSKTPDVNSCGVVLAAQENFWGSVPKCYHLKNITGVNSCCMHWAKKL